MGRPSQPQLSPEAIALAALELLDQDLEPSMRAIARHLGVSAPSLYHHVVNKDEVVNLIRDVLSASGPPEDDSLPWRERAERLFRGIYGLYAARPRLAEMFVRSPVSSRSVLKAYGGLSERMMAEGMSPRDIAVVLEMLDSHAIGVGLEHAAPAVVWEIKTSGHPLQLAGDAWPNPVERLDEAFDRGLMLILTYAETLLAPGRTRNPDS